MSELTEVELNNNLRLLAAARQDNEDDLEEILQEEGEFDINCQDGVGNTPLHLAVANGSIKMVELILECDGCDVDPQNRIERATPLHLALKLEDSKLRADVFGSLLEAGAETTIKNKNGDTVEDLVDSNPELRRLIKEQKDQSKVSQVQPSISKDDIASDGEDDGESGSGSDEE